jgi:hypothetical protein
LAGLGRGGGSIPSDEESELSFEEVSDFVERFQVMWSTLVALFIAEVGACTEFDESTAADAPHRDGCLCEAGATLEGPRLHHLYASIYDAAQLWIFSTEDDRAMMFEHA